MASADLSPLQRRVLGLLAGVRPPWTLVGGAALAGFHLHHRLTRDLDLFWWGARRLDEAPEECTRRLTSAGLLVERIQSGETFTRLGVRDGSESVVVDLVAEPATTPREAQEVPIGDARIRVATRHQILVDKLCALLGRSEVRDLIDVRALLAAGEDLARAVHDAPDRDAGFSPLTLAWLLRGLPLGALCKVAGIVAEQAGLEAFRDELAERLVRESKPPE